MIVFKKQEKMLLTPGNVQLQYGQRSSTFFAMPTDTISLKSYENLNLQSTTTAKKKKNLRFTGKSAPCACGGLRRGRVSPRMRERALNGIYRERQRHHSAAILTYFTFVLTLCVCSLSGAVKFGPTCLARPNTQLSSSSPLSCGQRARTKMAAKQRRTKQAHPS